MCGKPSELLAVVGVGYEDNSRKEYKIQNKPNNFKNKIMKSRQMRVNNDGNWKLCLLGG